MCREVKTRVGTMVKGKARLTVETGPLVQGMETRKKVGSKARLKVETGRQVSGMESLAIMAETARQDDDPRLNFATLPPGRVTTVASQDIL